MASFPLVRLLARIAQNQSIVRCANDFTLDSSDVTSATAGNRIRAKRLRQYWITSMSLARSNANPGEVSRALSRGLNDRRFARLGICGGFVGTMSWRKEGTPESEAAGSAAAARACLIEINVKTAIARGKTASAA